MAYYSVTEMQELLLGKQYLQEKLYVNGFLITDNSFEINENYPFYSNWKDVPLGRFHFYIHKNASFSVCGDNDKVFFIIGHAVDPFDGLFDEMAILKKLSVAFSKGIKDYYEAQDDLTGVYCTGVLFSGGIYISNDCAGMQIVYYGTVGGKHYFSSHSKLIADLLGLSQSRYVERLVNNRFYHYMGTWLPGDISPFPELRRLVPNHYIFLEPDGNETVIRYFPEKPIEENPDPNAFSDTINWLSNVLHETLSLYSRKWSDKEVAISVTGGRDSTTTLACANGLYDKFSYFSYISNEPEKVDAIAARDICRKIGLEHEIYTIPDKDSEFHDIDAFAAVLECNAGCIGKNNANDVRKRLFFIQEPKYDIEIKSWVNEVGRGLQYVKYNKRSFPKRPTAAYCRTMHKVYLSPKLIKETDDIFKAYLSKYLPETIQSKIPWIELFWWEFAWGGGEGIFLTAEHRTSSDIAIPYNNRKYLSRMLTVPLEKRKTDEIPKAIIKHMNSQIADTGIVIKDLKHTNRRAFIMRMYLEVFSRIKF